MPPDAERAGLPVDNAAAVMRALNAYHHALTGDDALLAELPEILDGLIMDACALRDVLQ